MYLENWHGWTTINVSPQKLINETIQLMGHKVLCSLIADLLSQTWFSLLADETRDISNHEQIVIIL